MPVRGPTGQFEQGFFDAEAFAEEIIGRAIFGLNKTLLIVESRAREKAPVRAIFRRSPRGTPEYPRAILTFKSKNPSYAAIIKALRKHPIETQNAMDLYKRSIGERKHEINVPRHAMMYQNVSARAGGKTNLVQELPLLGSENRQVRGHFNSDRPVLAEGKGRRPAYITGNFRQIQPAAGGGYELADVPYARRSRGGRAYIAGARNASEFLTKRGEFEVKSGRAKIIGASGEPQIGGALQKSIDHEDAVPESGGWVGYVTAGNAKVDYARFQEFGTSHNRAHPFMRPALYESRADFKSQVEAAIKRG